MKKTAKEAAKEITEEGGAVAPRGQRLSCAGRMIARRDQAQGERLADPRTPAPANRLVNGLLMGNEGCLFRPRRPEINRIPKFPKSLKEVS